MLVSHSHPVRPRDSGLPSDEQNRHPLAFVGAELKNAEGNLSYFEKEGFAIFTKFHPLEYMLLGHPKVQVFTDHRNLLFVLAPLPLEPALGREIISKVQSEE